LTDHHLLPLELFGTDKAHGFLSHHFFRFTQSACIIR
jgi:hypothetical protein